MNLAFRHFDDARAVLLTPEGRGAVATISVSGRCALKCVAPCFHSPRGVDLRVAPLAQIFYGRWGSATGEEVVVCRIRDDELELHCHGGHAAAARILADLEAQGAVVERWRAVNESLDPTSAPVAAFNALADCRTTRTAAILWDQYTGALGRVLLDVLTLLRAGDSHGAIDIIYALLARASVGLHLTEPWRVALVGEPNVGKSSLLNALLGFGRAIVHDQPGTTRDLVTGLTAFDGWPCVLVDTAGLRESAEPVERAGMQLATREIACADLLLRVRDISRLTAEAPSASLYDPANTLIVWNKCDLATGSVSTGAGGVLVSAKTGQGIEKLTRAIALRLVPNPPERGAAVPFTQSQVKQLLELCKYLRADRAQAAIEAIESWLAMQHHPPLPGEIRE